MFVILYEYILCMYSDHVLKTARTRAPLISEQGVSGVRSPFCWEAKRSCRQATAFVRMQPSQLRKADHISSEPCRVCRSLASPFAFALPPSHVAPHCHLTQLPPAPFCAGPRASKRMPWCSRLRVTVHITSCLISAYACACASSRSSRASSTRPSPVSARTRAARGSQRCRV